MEKVKNIVIGVIAFFIAATIGVIIFYSNLKFYDYTDNGDPQKKYHVVISKSDKTMKATIKEQCGYASCPGDDIIYTVKLTDDEYFRIMRMWGKKDIISPIIEDICLDDKILYLEYDEMIQGYNIMDSNHDGKVSYREYGNYLLNKEDIN